MTDRIAGGLTGKTRVLAVFGAPVEHSISPAMHNAAILELGMDLVYVPFRVEAADLPAAVEGVRRMGFLGVNLTIPLKEPAVKLVDELSELSARIGAVNTLYWKEGRLCGHSTDADGFILSLEKEMGKQSGEGKAGLPAEALVLGAGGSSRAVCFALASRGVRLTIANRTIERAETLVQELGLDKGVKVIPMEEKLLRRVAASSPLVVNTTSIGMVYDSSQSPLPSDCFYPGQIVYDLVYNPPETRLLAEARRQGALGVNGLKMLVYQGALSFELWTGVFPSLDTMETAAGNSL